MNFAESVLFILIIVLGLILQDSYFEQYGFWGWIFSFIIAFLVTGGIFLGIGQIEVFIKRIFPKWKK